MNDICFTNAINNLYGITLAIISVIAFISICFIIWIKNIEKKIK